MNIIHLLDIYSNSRMIRMSNVNYSKSDAVKNYSKFDILKITHDGACNVVKYAFVR